MRRIWVDEAVCDGCGVCAFICPHQVFELRGLMNKKGVTPSEPVRAELCDGCRYCDRGCPFLGLCGPGRRFGVCVGAGLCELACPQLAIRVEPFDERTEAPEARGGHRDHA